MSDNFEDESPLSWKGRYQCVQLDTHPSVSDAWRYPTDGMGTVIGIERRRACDVGEPVESALTTQALLRIAQVISGERDRAKGMVCVGCGEPVSSPKVVRCWACYRVVMSAQRFSRWQERDRKAVRAKRDKLRRAAFRRAGLNAKGKPLKLRQRYILQQAIG